MAKVEQTYNNIKITVITSHSSAMCYFNHGGRQYSQKAKGVQITKTHIDQMVVAAQQHIYKLTGMKEPTKFVLSKNE